jgi:hypothetical protein
VKREESNWPTPDASNHRDGEVLRKDNNLEQGGFHGVSLHHAMTKYGQAAPANPSMDGSRQESWATPNAFCYQPPENTEQWTKRAEYQQTEKGVNLHKPIQTQVLHEVEKMWRTPSVAEEKNQNTSTQIYLQNQVGATPKAWATPNTMDCLPPKSPEALARNLQKGGCRNLREDVVYRTGQWGKPTARDHKELTPMVERTQAGKLNPRWVETLMGLPVGWVMPSCASPVTIAPTNCGSSETESCQPQQSELFEF